MLSNNGITLHYNWYTRVRFIWTQTLKLLYNNLSTYLPT